MEKKDKLLEISESDAMNQDQIAYWMSTGVEFIFKQDEGDFAIVENEAAKSNMQYIKPQANAVKVALAYDMACDAWEAGDKDGAEKFVAVMRKFIEKMGQIWNTSQDTTS